ncbi:cytochrome c/c1 heme-lyase [Cytidiella melzeri]|nr:cytochrome c/c1 heme-lyase [Cytidiella melzeri]
MGQVASTQAQAPAECHVKHDAAPAQCPIPHSSASTTSASSSPAKCPIDHTAQATPASSVVETPAQCPIDHSGLGLDKRNQMPTLSQAPATNQSLALPTAREESTIPRDEASRWEYPSPQQFYNALVRKGWETPEEHVETMVHIHNFLNEEAWQEIVKWEKKENPRQEDLQLTRFKGRPGELSPKARFWLFAGWLLPSRFNAEPPFDRHDWIVKRKSSGEEVRYVIDYYSAPPEPDGSPVFSLDVRPALDSFGSVKQRIAAATEEAWASLRTESPSSTRASTGKA